MRSRRSLKVSHTQTSVPCGTLNELFLYYCAWQSELGHQGSKGSKYIGLKRVSPHILNSMYGVDGGHRMPSKAYPSVFIWYSILHFYEIKSQFSQG